MAGPCNRDPQRYQVFIFAFFILFALTRAADSTTIATTATTAVAATTAATTTSETTTATTESAETTATTDSTSLSDTNTSATVETTATSATMASTTTDSTTDTTATASSTASGSTTASTTTITSTSSAVPTSSSTTTTSSALVVPSLIVPDTADAPFMQKSDLPEGTVFICVGAGLAFLGLCVLAWRGLVAWSLQRSVRRAASQYSSDSKSGYGGGPIRGLGRYNGSNMSVDHMTSTNTAYRGAERSANQRTTKTHRPRGPGTDRTLTTSSLFFSPTAGPGAGSANVTSNRGSTYLPAGYYATGSVAAAAGAAITHIGGPAKGGYGRVESATPSPPDTPGQQRSPRRRGSQDVSGAKDQRRKRLGNNLGLDANGERTPSAVLDSWFDQSTATER